MTKLFYVVISSLFFISALPGDERGRIYLLTPDVFHGGECYYSGQPEIWYGMYKSKSGYFLKNTKVSFEIVHDPIIDSYGEKTGVRVNSEDADSGLVVLLKGPFGGSNNHLLRTSISEPVVYHRGDSLDISFGKNREVMIVTTGDSVFMHSRHHRQYLSYSYIEGYEAFLEIKWAGDLDRDNKLDLLVNDIWHYNTWINYRLFLSSFAKDGEVMGEVGRLMGQGC